jgi:hypothetical protein
MPGQNAYVTASWPVQSPSATFLLYALNSALRWCGQTRASGAGRLKEPEAVSQLAEADVRSRSRWRESIALVQRYLDIETGQQQAARAMEPHCITAQLGCCCGLLVENAVRHGVEPA